MSDSEHNQDERDLGPQPLDRMMGEWGMDNHDMVEVSTEQLTHKQVQKARKGRRLTLKMMQKVTRALNVCIWHKLDKEQKEAYYEYMHRELRHLILQYTLTAKRTDGPLYPKELKTIGDYLRTRRLDEKLSQRALAKMLGVMPQSIYCWENNKTEPRIHQWSQILNYLGEDYPKKISSPSDMLIWWRREKGIKFNDAAHQMGVDPSSWRRWESHGIKPTPNMLDRLRKFTGLDLVW